MLKVYSECPKCGNPGIEQPSEILPDKGTLIKVIHDNGVQCEFVEYQSISTFLERSKKKQDPKIMKCPICNKRGRIGNYRPSKTKNFHTWKYFIVHEQIEGYWGQKNKIRRYKRCYITTDEQKEKILKVLGRDKL